MVELAQSTSFSVVLVFVLCVCFVKESAQLRGTNTIHANAQNVPLGTFGFKRNGTVCLSSDKNLTSEKLLFFLCTRAQSKELTLISSNSNFCEINRTGICELADVAVMPSMVQNYSVKDSDEYSFFIANCGTFEQSFNLTYILLNPGGQELSVGQEPIQFIFQFSKYLWLTLAVLWSVEMVMKRILFKWISIFHVFVAAFIVLKIVEMAFGEFFWETLSDAGGGGLAFLDQSAMMISFLASQGMLFNILWYLGHGWFMITSSAPVRLLKVHYTSLMIVLAFQIFLSFDNSADYLDLSIAMVNFYTLFKVSRGFDYISKILERYRQQEAESLEQLTIQLEEEEGAEAAIGEQIARQRELMVEIQSKISVYRRLEVFVRMEAILIVAVIICKMSMPYSLQYTEFAIVRIVEVATALLMIFSLYPSLRGRRTELNFPELEDLSIMDSIPSLMPQGNGSARSGATTKKKIHVRNLAVLKVR